MTSRIAARRLALLLLLPGCHTWRPVALGPSTGYRRDGKVRVERRERTTDSAAVSADGSAGVSYAPVVFHGAWVDGDSLFGRKAGESKPVAIALSDARRLEERRVSGPRTTLLVAGVAVGAFALLIAAVVAAGPGMGY